METNTPLWLDLKKEYIDDNFEKLLTYLRDIGNKKDSFYDKTIELLRARVTLLIEELSSRSLAKDEEMSEDSTFNIRLLAAMMVADPEDSRRQEVFMAMLGELRISVPKFSEELMNTVMKSLRHEKIYECGFKWEDIINFQLEVFAYKVINNSKFLVPRLKERWWNDYGSVCLSKDQLFIISSGDAKVSKSVLGTTPSLTLEYGISVMPAGKEKLKQTMQNDLKALDTFTKDFAAELKKSGTPKAVAKKTLRNYSDGDEIEVRVTRIHEDTIYVETIDPDYNQMCGALVFNRSILFYYPNMFSRWLKPGNIIPATIESCYQQTFSIETTFVDFVVNDCKENCLDEESPAKMLASVNNEYVWINGYGFPIYTAIDHDYKKGDLAYVKTTKCSEGRFHGKINGEITGPYDDVFNENNIREECIQAFTREEVPLSETKDETSEPTLDPIILHLLIRHLVAHQKHLMKPSERCQTLAVARILSEMMHDEKAAAFIDFATSYMQALVFFAKDEDLRQINLTIPDDCKSSTSALMRLSVVELLKQWGKDGNEDILISAMRDFEQTMPVLSRIAKIIQTSNSMQEIVTGASLTVLKREVIKTLQIETEDESDIEYESGPYLGIESGSIEFKESVVFPPDNNMQADENRQIRNVLRGVCAFLNSQTGGTLYLGVSDYGYVKGIQNDLNYLRISSLDNYMRLHIQDKAKALLGLDILPCLKLEPMYDDQVVAIHVEPCSHRIVELEGKAYLRVNAESREMTEVMKQQIIGKKVFTNKEKAAHLADLQRGKQDEKTVILHNYASSHSGEFSDREVEAYEVYPESNLVVCLDLKDLKCKMFNLNRIGYVEVLDKNWTYKQKHKDIKVDVFHMTGEKAIHCTIELDLFARNLLIEEYPKAKNDLTKAKDSNLWILHTDIYEISGIGRFFIGLANHIRIIKAPELKEYVIKFKDNNLQNI